MATVTVNTADLEGAALDYAVAKSRGLRIGASLDVEYYGDWLPLDNGRLHEAVMAYMPSLDWAQGGQLIEKYFVTFWGASEVKNGVWYTNLIAGVGKSKTKTGEPVRAFAYVLRNEGHLIAAMRAIVAAELGETVDVPEELVK